MVSAGGSKLAASQAGGELAFRGVSARLEERQSAFGISPGAGPVQRHSVAVGVSKVGVGALGEDGPELLRLVERRMSGEWPAMSV